jgi:ADP-ribose pyrophosphatase
MTSSWRKLKSQNFKGSYKSYITEKYELPNGYIGDFDISLGPDFVVVFALTVNREVICVKQYRPGPEQILSEMVMGLIDEGETPEQAAARELLEESGYQAGKLVQLTERVPISPCRVSEFRENRID